MIDSDDNAMERTGLEIRIVAVGGQLLISCPQLKLEVEFRCNFCTVAHSALLSQQGSFLDDLTSRTCKTSRLSHFYSMLIPNRR